jgi:hypothetical protein
MADLKIEFDGMVLIAHGRRGEGWLVDTVSAAIGHTHQYNMTVNGKTQELSGGQLVSFESNDGAPLRGELRIGEVDKMVDLDEVLNKPTLKDALKTDQPKNEVDWRKLLSAWIRLPGGDVEVTVRRPEFWTFPRGSQRQLSDFCTVIARNVDRPCVRIDAPDGSTDTIAIPLTGDGVHLVHIKAEFTGGTKTALPAIGDSMALDEVLLLYRCVDEQAGPETGAAVPAPKTRLPRKIVTEEDVRRAKAAGVATTDPVSVCPGGVIHLVP